MWRQRSFRFTRQKSKYGNINRTYNGRTYHSKLEAKYAQDLDILQKAGEVVSWEPQYKISLDVNNQHICNYYVDFRVEYTNRRIELVEVKGFETEIYRLKRKLMEALYLPNHPDEEYVVVK